MATTNDRILLGTRKGLVEARLGGAGWRLAEPALAGQPIAYAMRDSRTGAVSRQPWRRPFTNSAATSRSAQSRSAWIPA